MLKPCLYGLATNSIHVKKIREGVPKPFGTPLLNHLLNMALLKIKQGHFGSSQFFCLYYCYRCLEALH